ncbi:MAG: hypothetical protein FJX76_22720 [Armatimonadetes bacterium]|nr:hypothetical protein [Armatimonadota bacterium]
MDDLREQIRAQEGGLEHLMRKIPGFSGYKDREQRRQADEIQRRFLADALTRERERLSDVGNILLSNGGLQLMDDLDRVRTQFSGVIDRIRHAPQGYAGFFDAIRINEAELDRVYEYDLGMVSEVASIGEGISALANAAQTGEAFGDRLRATEAQIKALNQKLDERSKTMMGVS